MSTNGNTTSDSLLLSSATSKRLKLESSDSVLIVEYRLPVRLFRKLASPLASSSSIGGSENSTTTSPRVDTSNGISSPSANATSSSSTTLSSTASYTWTAEWDAEALMAPKGGMSRALSQIRVKWIGTVNTYVPPEEEETVVNLLEKMCCIPVFLSAVAKKDFYDGFCKDTLWPIFHNLIDVYGAIPTRWWAGARQSDRWKAYMDVNQKFATTVVEQYHEGDLVWVQDYHLLLVPTLLARRRIAPVGLFLHVPFPSSEIFRTLSVRDELLRGMLSADHVSFHLFEYARHFLTSCRRLLGLTYTNRPGGCLSVEYQGREVMVTVTHTGIEPEYIQRYFASSSSICSTAADWRRRFSGKRIVAGLDSIERLRGVPNKLRAFESLLEQQPQLVGKIVLVQICLEDTIRPGDTQSETVSEIRELAHRINTRFGTSTTQGDLSCHLEIRRDSVPMSERLALWAASDVIINTTIRDSRSLHAFEYVYARSSNHCISAAKASAVKAMATAESTNDTIGMENSRNSILNCTELDSLPIGVLILSEFSSTSKVLRGALCVNPWNQEDVVQGLYCALTMSPREASMRAEVNLSFVSRNTTAAWAERVLVDLKTFGKTLGGQKTYMGTGLGLGYRLMGFGSTFRPLNVEHVLVAYKRASHRLIVCDYGGTLNVKDSSSMRHRIFEKGMLHGRDAAFPLTVDTRKALRILSEDPKNTVVIISGKEKDVLQEAFSALPHVALAAEHGYFFRRGAPLTSSASSSSANLSALTSSRKQISTPKGNSTITPENLTSQVSSLAPPLPQVLKGVGSSQSLASSNQDSPKDSLSTVTATAPFNPHPWVTLTEMKVDEWKSVASSIMEMYVARTNGTYILRKTSAISWHYADADTEFGSLQAKELQEHLTNATSNFNNPALDVLAGLGYVEVRPRGVNKGVVLSRLMDLIEQKINPSRESLEFINNASRTTLSASESVESGLTMSSSDSSISNVFRAQGSGGNLGGITTTTVAKPLEFILCIGDDQADEEMFTAVVAQRRARFSNLPSSSLSAALGVNSNSLSRQTNNILGPEGAITSPKPTMDSTSVAISTTAPVTSNNPVNANTGIVQQPIAATPLTYYEYTVTVGKKPSSAQYFLDDTQSVEDLMKSLQRASLLKAKVVGGLTGVPGQQQQQQQQASNTSRAAFKHANSVPLLTRAPIPPVQSTLAPGQNPTFSFVFAPPPLPGQNSSLPTTLTSHAATAGSTLNFAGLHSNVALEFSGDSSSNLAALGGVNVNQTFASSNTDTSIRLLHIGPSNNSRPSNDISSKPMQISFSPASFFIPSNMGASVLDMSALRSTRGQSSVLVGSSNSAAGSDGSLNGSMNSYDGGSGGVRQAQGLRAGVPGALAGLFQSSSKLQTLLGGGAASAGGTFPQSPTHAVDDSRSRGRTPSSGNNSKTQLGAFSDDNDDEEDEEDEEDYDDDDEDEERRAEEEGLLLDGDVTGSQDPQAELRARLAAATIQPTIRTSSRAQGSLTSDSSTNTNTTLRKQKSVITDTTLESYFEASLDDEVPEF